MPRNSSGTYSLPAGNPVITNTVISTAWGNTTLADLRTAMTDSLDRSGRGGMLAQLGLFSGTVGAPGLSWTAEATSGLYRAGAADFRWAIAGVDVFTITAAGITQPVLIASGTDPRIKINDTDSAANNRLWDFTAVADQLRFRVVNDADNAFVDWLEVDRTLNVVDSIAFPALGQVAVGAPFTTIGVATNAFLINGIPRYYMREAAAAVDNRVWRVFASGAVLSHTAINDALTVETAYMTVTRSGSTIGSVNFATGTLQYGSIEVGYRGMRQLRGISASDNTLDSDRGGAVDYSGAGGHTFTVDTDFNVSQSIMTIMNSGSGNLTITTSLSALGWFNGSGSVGSGPRTLAVGGVATLYCATAGGGGFIRIWGTGIS